VYDDPDLLAENPIMADLHAALSSTRLRPQSPAYRALSEAIFGEIHKMLQGEQDAATTATLIQRRLETLLR
jgi:maltose-binding protein MalE